MQARDLMETDVSVVHPDDEIGEVLGRLATVAYSGFPVVEDGRLVGIVTERDLVDLFQTRDRLYWIPIGFPPFTDVIDYPVNVSLEDLDLGVDLVENANRPVRRIMSTDVVTVGPDADLDELLGLLADADEDINRLPVVEDGDALVGIVTRQDVLRAIQRERASSAT
jgi:CBS domain-containing protein